MQKNNLRIYLNQEVKNPNDLCMELLKELNKLELEKECQKLEIISPISLNDFSLEQKMQILHKLLELRVVFKFISKS
ncbi:TPA: hypothetical protein ACG3IS_003746 [Clostridioides difficile]